MTRQRVLWSLALVLSVLFGVFVARNTYWADINVPGPMKGEALHNPFYAAQKFTEALGARATRDVTLTVPPTTSVIVMSAWHWDLSAERRDAIQQWVEGGGRLVVDSTLTGGEDAFEQWSGITRDYDVDDSNDVEVPSCLTYDEGPAGIQVSGGPAHPRRLCQLSTYSSYTTTRQPDWMMTRRGQTQAVRITVGRGSVTAINGDPFRRQALLDGEHAWLLVAAAEMRPGDDVHFLSEDDYPTLLSMLWKRFGPAVALALALVAVVLVRGSIRFGPIEAPAVPGRRSLAEQIRGSSQFALRHGDRRALVDAAARALDEAARKRIAGYDALGTKDRSTAIARLTGFEPKAIASGLVRSGGTSDIRTTIALLEAARRQLLDLQRGNRHGAQ